MRAFIVLYVFSANWRAERAVRCPPDCTASKSERCQPNGISGFHFEGEHGEDQRHYLSQ
jgi:hypothetical protein